MNLVKFGMGAGIHWPETPEGHEHDATFTGALVHSRTIFPLEMHLYENSIPFLA